jgi:hypothetical protein
MSATQNQTYREKSAECAAAAELAVDPMERLELLKIAQAFLRLAEHVEEIAGLRLPLLPTSFSGRASRSN